MLVRKVKAVQKLYAELEMKSSRFAAKSEIACIKACSACCLYKNIEATALEFLPAAYNLITRGNYESLMDKLENNEDSRCAFYNPFLETGACSAYNDRGLICRLFGFSAKLDKYNQPSLVSCRFIKSELDPQLLYKHLGKAPVVSEYYMKMYGIDPWLGSIHYPINTAIRKALEFVFLNTQFRRPRKAS